MKISQGVEYVSELATIYLSVLPVNDPPIISTIPDLIINEDEWGFSFDLNPYIENDDGGYLTYLNFSDTSALINEPDLEYVYFLLEQNWNGISTITSIVTDEFGLSNTASLK